VKGFLRVGIFIQRHFAVRMFCNKEKKHNRAFRLDLEQKLINAMILQLLKVIFHFFLVRKNLITR